jgi:nitrous oxidase accessory protein NosD
VPVLGLLALALPSSAFGQATRTWVSGVGDDANPCSRTAPCKTFAGAISKTANGGEINVIDPGGFGGVTITKSLTIKGAGITAGVLVSGTNAIVINATATDKVTLRGLDINGIGVGAQTSLNGIKVLSAARVSIVDNEIYRFKDGINVNPTSSSTRVVIAHNHIHDNGVGVITAPGNNAVGFTNSTLRYNDIQDNQCGVVTSAFGTNSSTPDANLDCGAATSASGITAPSATTRIWHTGVNDNPFGVFGRGPNSFTELGYSEVTGSQTFGLRRLDSATIKGTTPATNVFSNAASDTTNGTVTLGKRKAKRVAR